METPQGVSWRHLPVKADALDKALDILYRLTDRSLTEGCSSILCTYIPFYAVSPFKPFC